MREQKVERNSFRFGKISMAIKSTARKMTAFYTVDNGDDVELEYDLMLKSMVCVQFKWLN